MQFFQLPSLLQSLPPAYLLSVFFQSSLSIVTPFYSGIESTSSTTTDFPTQHHLNEEILLEEISKVNSKAICMSAFDGFAEFLLEETCENHIAYPQSLKSMLKENIDINRETILEHMEYSDGLIKNLEEATMKQAKSTL